MVCRAILLFQYSDQSCTKKEFVTVFIYFFVNCPPLQVSLFLKSLNVRTKRERKHSVQLLFSKEEIEAWSN